MNVSRDLQGKIDGVPERDCEVPLNSLGHFPRVVVGRHYLQDRPTRLMLDELESEYSSERIVVDVQRSHRDERAGVAGNEEFLAAPRADLVDH